MAITVRKKWLKLRISDEEKTRLDSRAREEGITVADLIRPLIEARLSELPPKKIRRSKKEISATDQRLIREISKVGNNLNQIARWCNQNKKTIERVELLTALAEIEKSMQALMTQGKKNAP